MRTEFSFRIAIVALALIPAAPVIVAAANDGTATKELVEYVHDARQRGVAETNIKKQAVAAGWSEAAVNEAISYEKNVKSSPLTSAAAVDSKTSTETASSVVRAADASTPEPTPTAGAPKVTVLGVGDDYLIGSGDTLQIAVWREPDASVPSVVVRPDGKITMPLIKEVEVAGLTPRQAEAAITERLGALITSPNVTVVVASINSKKVYLIGAVKKEGTLPYTYGMTVMQALSEAGGLNEYAKRKKIYILRTENGREYRLDFNYQEVIRGERMEQNAVLLPGDTVVVPQ